MSFISNIAEGVSNFFVNKDQANYVNQQVDILNKQAEENQKRLKYVLFFFVGGVVLLSLVMLLQRR